MQEQATASPAALGMRRKPIPSEEFNILPSLEDHHFFEHAENFPFRSAARDFSVVNAWWAAEASMLAYREPDEVAEVLDEGGLMVSESVGAEGTRCFLLHGPSVVIVVFRDAELAACDALYEASDPARTGMRPFGGAGHVHGPFVEAFDRVWEALVSRLDALHAELPGRPIWMAGHGHGGALAIMAASRYRRARGAYTFGSPRFADQRFAERCPGSVYRIVHNNDYAPNLPPELPAYVPAIGGRTHAGELRFIDRRGRMSGKGARYSVGSVDRAASSLKGGLQSIRSCGWALRQAVAASPRAPVPWEAIRDHAPIYYAVHLWNAMVERGPGAEPV